MLGNLLKYEFRALMKQFAIIYPTAVIIAVVTGVLQSNYSFLQSSFNPMATVVEFLFMGIMMAMSVLTIAFILGRFNTGLLKDEGYLMFTLPTKTSTLLLSKVCIAMLAVVISGIIGFLSAFLLAVGTFGLTDVLAVFSDVIYETLSLSEFNVLHLIEIIIVSLSYCLSSILLAYLAISIGHLSGKHRTIVAILSWIVVNTLWGQLLQLLGTILQDSAMLADFMIWFDRSTVSEVIHAVLLIGLAINLIWSAILFAGTNYILKNKLNLE